MATCVCRVNRPGQSGRESDAWQTGMVMIIDSWGDLAVSSVGVLCTGCGPFCFAVRSGQTGTLSVV